MTDQKQVFEIIDNPGDFLAGHDIEYLDHIGFKSVPENQKFIINNLWIFGKIYGDKWVKVLFSPINTQNTIIKAFSNIQEYLLDDKEDLTPNSMIRIGDANSFYWLIADACSSSIKRIKSHGYKLDDVVPIQEALCAIYRRNEHDNAKLFFQYLYGEHSFFVLNDCFNCYLSDRKKCKLYLPQLDHANVKRLRLWKFQIEFHK